MTLTDQDLIFMEASFVFDLDNIGKQFTGRSASSISTGNVTAWALFVWLDVLANRIFFAL